MLTNTLMALQPRHVIVRGEQPKIHTEMAEWPDICTAAYSPANMCNEAAD